MYTFHDRLKAAIDSDLKSIPIKEEDELIILKYSFFEDDYHIFEDLPNKVVGYTKKEILFHLDFVENPKIDIVINRYDDRILCQAVYWNKHPEPVLFSHIFYDTKNVREIENYVKKLVADKFALKNIEWGYFYY